MSELAIQQLNISVDDKTSVHDVSLTLRAGEIHLLIGPNGSGKTSLLNGLMGHPKYKIANGSMTLDGEDITNEPTEQKAKRGIFLSLQHLPEIAGVTLTNFLFRAYKSVKGGETAPLEFYQMMQGKAKEFGIDATLLKKHLNAGLSGGEKKQSELLQLLALAPAFALLDEIDSGVDVDAQKKLFAIITQLAGNGTGFLLVSHHPNILEYVSPHTVHVMRDGRIVKSGGRELVEEITRGGFDAIS